MEMIEQHIEPQVPTTARRAAGVYESDAPDGYIALVVYSASGRRLLRLEVAQDCYSAWMVLRLERWLRWITPREQRRLRILH